MILTPVISWRIDDEPLDPRLLPLLEAIAANASLAGAVLDLGMSYRAAWGLLRDYERKLNAALVTLERGRGARLAPAGEQLILGQRSAEKRLARVLPGLAVNFGRPHDPAVPRAEPLRIAASHDLALAALRDAAFRAAGLSLDIEFMGSLRALEEYAAARFDVAGFHAAPRRRRGAWNPAPFHRLLRSGRDRLIHFVDRDQGFILARGNPKRVRTFADVARKGLRFVNRQRGSGTRMLIDRLAADEGVDPATLDGYANEEFTHAAIAATVASGAADVGFGLRAAAAERGLAFVPQIRERYYLVVRASVLPTPAVNRLLAALQGSEFRRIVDRLPGYRRPKDPLRVELAAL